MFWTFNTSLVRWWQSQKQKQTRGRGSGEQNRTSWQHTGELRTMEGNHTGRGNETWRQNFKIKQGITETQTESLRFFLRWDAVSAKHVLHHQPDWLKLIDYIDFVIKYWSDQCVCVCVFEAVGARLTWPLSLSPGLLVLARPHSFINHSAESQTAAENKRLCRRAATTTCLQTNVCTVSCFMSSEFTCIEFLLPSWTRLTVSVTALIAAVTSLCSHTKISSWTLTTKMFSVTETLRANNEIRIK